MEQRPLTAIIGGSNAFRILDASGKSFRLMETLSTPYGVPSPVFIYDDDFILYFIARHGSKGYEISAPNVNYRANIYALKDLGVESILAWSGPGAINNSYSPGDIVIPSDIIDWTKQRATTFFEGSGLGFIRQNPVFCPELRQALLDSLKNLKYPFRDGGVYICTEGPRLETSSEIRMFSTFGGDMVGMTLSPECFLARELEICYVPMCYITNYAEGVRHSTYRSGELFEGLATQDELSKVEESFSRFIYIIWEFTKFISERNRCCPCSKSMERYRKKGVISEDWHNWISKK